MDLATAAVNMAAAETLARVQMAAAAKVLSIAQDQGEVVTALLDAAVEVSDQAAAEMAAAVDGLGANLNVVG